MFSTAEMEAASAEVRALAMAMDRAMQEMDLPDGWSGADADQFQRQWRDLVYSRLMAAANKLDGLSWREIEDVFNG